MDHLFLLCYVAYAIWIVFSVVLLCLELCLDVQLIYLLVNELLAIRVVLLCGRWLLRALYGVYRGK
jgi:hypothetical protein